MTELPTKALSSEDRTALQDVMLNYAAGVDERDIERYTACFAPQVEVHNLSDRTFHDRDSWVEYVWGALTQYRSTQHLLGPQYAYLERDAQGTQHAQTRSDVQAMHVFADSEERLTLWATYQTRMTRIEGRWLITRHELQVRDMLRS